MNKGFSLIEVAIVLSIIGILMGFSLKGRSIIDAAKTRSFISQIENYKAAIQIFNDRYGALPGDFNDADKAISSDCPNGDLNGQIKTLEEAKRFWIHLAKSGLITDNLHNGFPTTKLGGILTVSTALSTEGLWLIWCRATNDNENFSPIIDKQTAYKINKAMGGSSSNTGDVRIEEKDSSCYLLFRLW